MCRLPWPPSIPGGSLSGRGARADGGAGEKAGAGAATTKEGARDGWAEQPSEKRERGLKHYDADGAYFPPFHPQSVALRLTTRVCVVLTKVFVYCGIGMVATGVVPVMFEVLGWGVKMA